MSKIKNILITGGAGFIGSNFISFLLNKSDTIRVVNLDNLTYAGDLSNLKKFEAHPRYHFIKGDICDADLVHRLFDEFKIDGVYHFAAESHVDNSIEFPGKFIKTNVEGTFTLLEAAKKYWLTKQMQPKEGFFHARFLHVSTDEVYGALGDEGFFTESTPYAPNSPYSASKASSDFLVRSYFHTYGLNVVTTNCSNNYGPHQHDEKLIPTVIRKALANEAIPVYGTGNNVRDWLFVEDHCNALEMVFNNGKTGETYLIGGNNEKDNLSIVKKICAILDKMNPKESGIYSDQISFVKDRLGHDFRYAIDATKIKSQLGWQDKVSFTEGLEKTVQWYFKKYQKV